MALTYTALASVTVGSGGADAITFDNIPGTYTDLLIKFSVRRRFNNPNGIYIKINNSTSNFTGRILRGDGSSVSSLTDARLIGTDTTTAQTANTFSSGELYLPNYTSSNNKSFSSDCVSENNGTTAYADLVAGLWSNTAVITSVAIENEMAQYSTATLYGIKNTV